MTDSTAQWFYRRGTLARGEWQSVVDDTIDGWAYTGLRVGELTSGRSLALPAGARERIIVPLAGSFTVRHDEGETVLHGRASVFDGPTDVLFLPRGCAMQVQGEGRFAVAEAPAHRSTTVQYIPAAETPVELRGAGRSSRQVHNFGTPDALDADRLIVCEVLTPAENWSSYPPHKHDEHVPGHESRLEEIYYFEAAPIRGADAPDASAAFGMFSTYSSPAGDIEIDAMVRTGDVALVPFGYHGPAVAAPGYDLYYLNVMAGPDAERSWLISDDPAHGWVRNSWQGQERDERLPFAPDGGTPS